MEIYVFKNLNSIVAHKWRYIKDYDSYIKNNSLNLVYSNTDFNFHFNDYVYTDIIINTGDQYLTSDTQLTYVIVKAGDSDYSSWYVLNTDQIRGNQYKLHLKRDLLNDYAAKIKDLNYNINRCFYRNLDFSEINNFIYSHLKYEDNYWKENKNEFFWRDYELIYDPENEEWSPELHHDFMLSTSDFYRTYKKAVDDTALKVHVDFTEGYYLIFMTENMSQKNFDEVICGDKWHLYNSNLNDIGSYQGLVPKNGLFNWIKNSNSDYWFEQLRTYTEPYLIAAVPRKVYSYSLAKYINIESIIADIKERFGDNILDIQYVDTFVFTQSIWDIAYDENNEKYIAFYNYFAQVNSSNQITAVCPIFGVKDNLFSKTMSIYYSFNTNLEDMKIYNTKYSFRIVNYTQDNTFTFNLIDYLDNNKKLDFLVSNYARPYSSTVTFNSNSSNSWIAHVTYSDKEFYFTDTGNKSLSLNTSQFTQYELDNKNYQNIFNRQIQSQDISFTLNQAASTVSDIMQVAKGGTQLMSGVNAGFGLSNIFGGISNQLQRPFEIANYFNSRQTQIDTFNMQIDNIKNRADKPIINLLFSKTFYYHYMLKIYKDSQSNIDEYTTFLHEKGIMWNAKNITLSDFFTNIKMTTYLLMASQPYFRGEIDFCNTNNVVTFNNRIYNEINEELSNGVYMEKEVFDLIKG